MEAGEHAAQLAGARPDSWSSTYVPPSSSDRLTRTRPSSPETQNASPPLSTS